MKQEKRIYPSGVCAIKPANLEGANVTLQMEPVLRGGAASIWFRPPASEKLGDALPARGLCDGHHVPFLVIDDLELAHDVRAAGVVLEAKGSDVEAARKTLGEHALIGVYCDDDLDRAIRAKGDGADFVVLTASDGGPPDAKLISEVRSRNACQVVAAADSLSLEAAAELARAGADVLAVSDVFSAANPNHATADLVQQIQEARK